MRKLLLLLLCLLPQLTTWADDKATTFSDGFFIVNEDWYGTNNSTINWFGYDGEITTRVVQTVNGADVQLGCTAPVGTISNGRMYVTCKQPQDPGASVTGGRLTVLDASTMQVLKQIQEFPNGGDGRDVCAVSDSKVYVGSTMGIYFWTLRRWSSSAWWRALRLRANSTLVRLAPSSQRRVRSMPSARTGACS